MALLTQPRSPSFGEQDHSHAHTVKRAGADLAQGCKPAEEQYKNLKKRKVTKFYNR